MFKAKVQCPLCGTLGYQEQNVDKNTIEYSCGSVKYYGSGVIVQTAYCKETQGASKMSKAWLTLTEMADAAIGKYKLQTGETFEVDTILALEIANRIAAASKSKAARVNAEV